MPEQFVKTERDSEGILISKKTAIRCNCGKVYSTWSEFDQHMYLNNGQGGTHG